MADNNINGGDNIWVDFDYQNVFLVDPNKTVDLNGVARERQIHHENLVMYANLEATIVFPRTKLAVETPSMASNKMMFSLCLSLLIPRLNKRKN